ncbi:MAG: hypothetical protein KAJ35_04865 [Thermoplasmata archaeon]|nr:hypothetical protein [Thermoplasmata archaeon]
MWKGSHLAIVSLLILLAGVAMMTSGDTVDPPDDRVMCDECHDDFVPFQLTIDAPTGVPIGEPFDLSITVFNEEMHAVYYPSAMLTVTDGEGMVIETGEPVVDNTRESGSLGFRQSTEFVVTIPPGAQSATFALDGSGGLLNDLDLFVSGPDGGSWSSTGGGTAETIDLDAGALQEGGHGDYRVTVEHTQGVRPTSFTLDIGVEYGSGSMVLYGPEDLQQDDSYTFTFTLWGGMEGPSAVTVVVSGQAVHMHTSGEHEERDYTMEEEVPIEVGDEFVYGGRDDGGDAGSGEGLLSAGQALGFLSAILLIGSLATSGHLPKLPKRGKVHCYISYGLTGVFFVHWLTLWAGPYGSTYGGIGTGSVMLVLILVLAASGIRPKVFDGKLLGWSNRLLHRNLTYVLVLVLVVHVMLNGSHFAFVRGG